VLIAAAVPILGLILANPGRTRVAGRDITGLEPVRRPPRSAAPRVHVPEVRLTPVDPTQPAGELLSFRNPFAFAPRNLPPGPPPVTIAPPVPPPPDTPSSVALSLIGVATTSRADGRAERTAIIAGPADAFYFVREGDTVMTCYRVEAVLPDSVLLGDSATGVSLRLLLR
jgi:hypothetical protein